MGRAEPTAGHIARTVEQPDETRAEQEARNLWERAMQLLMTETADGEKVYRDAASYLMMAIEQSPRPFPEAHSLLALIGLHLGDADLADKHADLALRYDQTNFVAQSVKVRPAASKLQRFKILGLANMDGSLLDAAIGVWLFSMRLSLRVASEKKLTNG